ncbi:MAG: HAD-IIIC family phosphatase, partial [Myxococcota bacterium]
LGNFVELSPEARRAEVSQIVGEIGSLAERHAQGKGILLIHNFVIPDSPVMGLRDVRDPFGERAIFAAANEELAAACRKLPGAFVVDVEALAGRIGKDVWTDPKMVFLARMEVSRPALGELARETTRFIRALAGKARKVLVLDLDNTLWGGIIGEDGLPGIKLGDAAPGNAYVAFQRRLLALHGQGVLLAINSANNPGDATEALQSHPEMVLRPDHFAAMRINWNDKTDNMRALADELNLGLDAFVFWDDNPSERERMRALLPEVLTVEVPRDPALYARTLSRLDAFDTLSLTEEDRARGRMMAQGRARTEARARVATEAAFLESLDIRATIAPPDNLTLPRFAQLTQRTNQFNLTTRRTSEADLAKLASGQKAFVRGLRVADRFGDEGWVGLAIIAREGDRATINTFLMSCRVIGRKIEHAFLSALLADLKAAGVARVDATYRPTPKNGLCARFWEDAGFEPAGEDDGEKRYTRNLADALPPPPAHVALTRAPA